MADFTRATGENWYIADEGAQRALPLILKTFG